MRLVCRVHARAIATVFLSSLPVSAGVIDEQLVCGQNSLYVLHSMLCPQSQRAEVAFHIYDQLPPGIVDFLDLKRVAGQLGIEGAVHRIQANDIWEEAAPFIAHLNYHTNSEVEGHFVVVVGMEEDCIEFIDPSAGLLRTFEVSRFFRHFSGYIFRPSRGLFAFLDLAMIALLALQLRVLSFLVRR